MSSPENAVMVYNQAYPPPLASHDDVVRDGALFWETLRSFHRMMGTKCIAPVIGGRELDLHVLYTEVTRRGGFEKVVILKKWREVSTVFRLSATTTSASYALRKHYFNLLYHYEFVYFLKSIAPAHVSSGPATFHATGTIEAKFEYGYSVTMKLDSKIFHGVLYHPVKQPRNQPCTDNNTTNSLALADQSNKRRRRRKKRNRGDRPKPNRSGYNFFFSEKHAELKTQCPEREREFTRMIADCWNNLSNEEKQVYQNEGQKDKERYRRELAEYKDRLKARQAKETEAAMMDDHSEN